MKDLPFIYTCGRSFANAQNDIMMVILHFDTPSFLVPV